MAAQIAAIYNKIHKHGAEHVFMPGTAYKSNDPENKNYTEAKARAMLPIRPWLTLSWSTKTRCANMLYAVDWFYASLYHV